MTQQRLDINFWSQKRQIIRDSYGYTEHWKEVIYRIKQRIEDFYFKPIYYFQDPNKLKDEGFIIYQKK